ncbi:lipoprotein LpqH [Mycolicibacterium fluoranthenivorans]|uniref:Lipoprotein LpqH n=1 Tax=Mycolicibacterium fluoranthenivorans TaxID=258505 RepID=A0A7X5U4Q4_9MYCO|nr:lipoprotein LpqH [Mycolicibacterium fluoranthenivorans]MCV7355419.1 lipoprotein LpqH [Mycolicibacterium fluoranthenivorans]NIH98361.1 lipoprotein LpqH [Mycolicibacterium fluoranthenivorans]
MKRELVVALGGAAIVIAGLSGCSSDDKKSSSSSSSEKSTSSASATATATESPTAAAGSGATKVTIDGADQAVNGSVVCATMGGNVNIAIGEAATGIAAVLSDGDSPTVTSVGLGNVNGVTLGYQSGAGQGEAKAEKDGKTYKISGTATGIDMANPMTPVNKPFTIEVTCPN